MKRKQISAFGWVELLLGVLFIALGVYSFTNPTTALGGIVVAFGAVVIISGIANIVMYAKIERRTRCSSVVGLVGGILNIIFGILLLFNVEIGRAAVGILFPLWFIVHCTVRLSTLNIIKSFGSKLSFWVSLIASLFGIVIGFSLLLNPFASAISFAYIVGGYLVVAGVSSVITAFSKLGERPGDDEDFLMD